MSGFHPVLWLLAVAVCISYSEGAPFSAVQKDDITAHKLHNEDLRTSVQTARDGGALPNRLENKIAQRDDSLDTNVIDERNYKNIHQPAGLLKLNNFKSIYNDDVLTKDKAKEAGSGSLGTDSGDSDGILQGQDTAESKESSSSESEESDAAEPNPSDASNVDSVLSGSQPEDECEDEENNGGNHDSTLNPDEGEGSSTLSPHSPVSEGDTDEGPITSNPTSPSNDEDQDCEETESKKRTPLPPTTTTTTTTTTMTEAESESSSSESIESTAPSQESQESEECDDSVSPTSTQPSRRTTTPTKKPRDTDQSSGSFHDSDPNGVDFSDSVSQESRGRSTEFIDK